MFAPLKRIAFLAALLVFPGVAFSYVSIEKIEVDNNVPDGAEGFVVSITAEVDPDDSWQSSHFNFDNYSDICLDHDDFGPGKHQQVFYVPFDGDQAGDYGNDDFDFRTFDDDNCGDDNQDSVWNRYIYVEEFDWDEVTGFAVQKAFRPYSDQEVQVNINCSAGSPGDDSAMVAHNEIQIFPQEFLNPSNPNHNCVITEADVPAGYSALYVTNPVESSGLYSTEGCFFYGSGNMRSTNTCQIINLGLPSTFTLTKAWEVFQDDDAAFVEVDELRVLLGVACSRRVLAAHVADQDICRDDENVNSPYQGCSIVPNEPDDAFYWNVVGDARLTVTVDNTGEVPANCAGLEQVRYSNHERTFSNCLDPTMGYEPIRFELAPGGSAGCGYTNTVFFEGIPTLSQYGMAIMALLMLGVGFVGFRRFV